MSEGTSDHAKPIDALSIDDVDRELIAINERLDALPADDFAARVDLHQRHLELKARAAQLNAGADENRSTEDLEAEIRSLDRRIAAIQDELIDVPEQDGEGNITGPSGKERGSGEMNREIANAAGASELVARRDKLEQIVRARA